MSNIKHLLGKTGVLLAALFMCFGMHVLAAPTVKGDTELTAVTDELVKAEFTITNDQAMESVELQLTYDRNILTYMSGSGGNRFSGSGGNGLVQLSSQPGENTASFTVSFRGKTDEETSLSILSCIIVVDGEEIDVLNDGEDEEEESSETEEETADDDGSRASFVIDERTFYVRRPGDIDGFETIHMDIQGIDSRVLKHDTLDIYVVYLRSDNGSYRDYFVYNPDTGNVIPYVQMENGIDDVIFIEPDENVYIPDRYIFIDLGWGPKYTLPAYKHVTIDGVDEILDDTNRYLLYGINQDGEKAWYSYDYDKNSVQLFDEVAYQGELNYIESLKEAADGLSTEHEYQRERYNQNMGRRLTIIMVMTIIIIILLNVIVVMYLKMRKMRIMEDGDEEDEAPRESVIKRPKTFVTGNLEENETDFREPSEIDDDIELEIIDLDDLD